MPATSAALAAGEIAPEHVDLLASVIAERCDVDHDVPPSHGGITAQHNGRLRCPTHNRNPAKRNQHPRNDPTTTDDEDDDP